MSTENINILDQDSYFVISGSVCNIRQREYNGNITKYLMIEDMSNPEWPNYFEVEFYKDKADLVANVREGDYITANINFGGRKWEKDGEVKGAFFSLKGWKVEVAQNAVPTQSVEPQAPAPDYSQSKEGLDSDCPF